MDKISMWQEPRIEIDRNLKKNNHILDFNLYFKDYYWDWDLFYYSVSFILFFPFLSIALYYFLLLFLMMRIIFFSWRDIPYWHLSTIFCLFCSGKLWEKCDEYCVVILKSSTWTCFFTKDTHLLYPFRGETVWKVLQVKYIVLLCQKYLNSCFNLPLTLIYVCRSDISVSF